MKGAPHTLPYLTMSPSQWEAFKILEANPNIPTLLKVLPQTDWSELIVQIVIANLSKDKTTYIVYESEDFRTNLEKSLNANELSGLTLHLDEASFTNKKVWTNICQKSQKELTDFVHQREASSVLAIKKDILEEQLLSISKRCFDKRTIGQWMDEFINLRNTLNIEGEIPKIEIHPDNYNIIEEIIKDASEVKPEESFPLVDQLRESFFQSQSFTAVEKELKSIIKDWSITLKKCLVQIQCLIEKYESIRRQDIHTRQKKIEDLFKETKELFSEEDLSRPQKKFSLAPVKGWNRWFGNKEWQEKKNQFLVRMDRIQTKAEQEFGREKIQLKNINEALKELDDIKELWDLQAKEELKNAKSFILSLDLEKSTFYQFLPELTKIKTEVSNKMQKILGPFSSDNLDVQDLLDWILQLSNEWPIGIENFKNWKENLRWKHYLLLIPENLQPLVNWCTRFKGKESQFLRLAFLNHLLPKLLGTNKIQNSSATTELEESIINARKEILYKFYKKRNSKLNDLEFATGPINKELEKRIVHIENNFPILFIHKKIANRTNLISQYHCGICQSNVYSSQYNNIRLAIDYLANKPELKNNIQADLFASDRVEETENFDYDIELQTKQGLKINQRLIGFHNHLFQDNLIETFDNHAESVVSYQQVDGLFNGNINKRESEKFIQLITSNEIPSNINCAIVCGTREQAHYVEIQLEKISKENQDFQDKWFCMKQNGSKILSIEEIRSEQFEYVFLLLTFGNNIKHQFKTQGSILEEKELINYLFYLSQSAYKRLYLFNSIRPNVFSKWTKLPASKYELKSFYAFLAYLQAVSEEDYYSSTEVLTKLKPEVITTQTLSNARSEISALLLEEVVLEIKRNIPSIGPAEIKASLGQVNLDIFFPEEKIAVQFDYQRGRDLNLFAPLFFMKQSIYHQIKIVETWTYTWYNNKAFALDKLIKEIHCLLQS